jgi:hypothetical protein
MGDLVRSLEAGLGGVNAAGGIALQKGKVPHSHCGKREPGSEINIDLLLSR